MTFILSGIFAFRDSRARHLVVPEFIAFHIVNIHTGSTAANVNLVIIHTNHVFTVVWFNGADSEAVDRVAEVFCLLVEDFHGSRDSLCLVGCSSVQINCNDLAITDSYVLYLSWLADLVKLIMGICIVNQIALGGCNDQMVGFVVIDHAVLIITLFRKFCCCRIHLDELQWLLVDHGVLAIDG